MIRKLLYLLTAGWLACIAMKAGAAELTFALEPFLSSRALVSSFQPLRDCLARQLDTSVVLLTAPNYPNYMARLLDDKYDIALIGPHSAWLAARQAGYIPLVSGAGTMKAVVLVPLASPVHQLADLRGLRVAFPDRLTLTSMLGAEMMERAGLHPDNDVKIEFNDFHNTAALKMLRGEAAAAVVADAALLAMSPDIRKGIRVIGESKPVPQMVLLVSKRMPQAQREQVRAAVELYLRTADPARDFLTHIGMAKVRPLSEQDEKQMLPYVEELQRRLVH